MKEEATTQMKMSTFESGARLPPKKLEKRMRIPTLFEHSTVETSLNDYVEVMKHITRL